MGGREIALLARAMAQAVQDHEALPEVSEAMVTLAMIRLMLHRLAHPNRRRLAAPSCSKGVESSNPDC